MQGICPLNFVPVDDTVEYQVQINSLWYETYYKFSKASFLFVGVLQYSLCLSSCNLIPLIILGREKTF
jgi:hypothetical protein